MDLRNSASPSGGVHGQCMWSGSMTQASILRHAGAHPPNRVQQRVDLRHLQMRTPVEQVHRKREYARSGRMAECVTLFPAYTCCTRGFSELHCSEEGCLIEPSSRSYG